MTGGSESGLMNSLELNVTKRKSCDVVYILFLFLNSLSYVMQLSIILMHTIEIYYKKCISNSLTDDQGTS